MNHDLDKLGKYSINYNLSNFYPLASAWLEMLLLEKPPRVFLCIVYTFIWNHKSIFYCFNRCLGLVFNALCFRRKKTKYFFKAKRKGAYARSVFLRKRTCIFIVVLQSVVVNIHEVHSQFLVLAILGYLFYNSADS